MNLGGGGHPLAAGCTLDGPLDKAETLVVDLSLQAIETAVTIDSHPAHHGRHSQHRQAVRHDIT